MTSYEEVYAAFLSKIADDEWTNWTWEEVKMDLRTILESAIPWFKFPAVSLERDEEGFLEVLSTQEIQVLASYMKVEWIGRVIATWENLRPLYTERDFSQANLISKFQETLEKERVNARKLEAMYYRSIGNKPFNFSRLTSR